MDSGTTPAIEGAQNFSQLIHEDWSLSIMFTSDSFLNTMLIVNAVLVIITMSAVGFGSDSKAAGRLRGWMVVAKVAVTLVVMLGFANEWVVYFGSLNAVGSSTIGQAELHMVIQSFENLALVVPVDLAGLGVVLAFAYLGSHWRSGSPG